MLKNLFIAAGLLLTQSVFAQSNEPHYVAPKHLHYNRAFICIWPAIEKDKRHDVGVLYYKDDKRVEHMEPIHAIMNSKGNPKIYLNNKQDTLFFAHGKLLNMSTKKEGIKAAKLHSFLIPIY